MHINVLVRATSTSIENITESPWAGVDHGVYLLLKDGIIPKYTYGDFDSITEKERRFIDETLEINPVESEKDDTDLEIALLDLTERGYTSIDVYGATGGRLDHLLGNTQMLLHEKLTDVKIRIIDTQNVVELLNKGRHEVLKNRDMKYVSFLPMYDRTRLTLEQFKYPLEGTKLSLGSTLTISNEFTGEKGFVETSEPILMIQSID